MTADGGLNDLRSVICKVNGSDNLFGSGMTKPAKSQNWLGLYHKKLKVQSPIHFFMGQLDPSILICYT